MNFVQAPVEAPEFCTVVDFYRWYVQNKCPVMLSLMDNVFLSDDATAVRLFRSGRFQVEMYLIHPSPIIPAHEHPGVDNIELQSLTFHSSEELAYAVQTDGKAHGGSFVRRAEDRGFALFSVQHWRDGIEMSTIGARWKGHTAGPKHEALIRRFNPECLIYPGYADVTRTATVNEIL
jgi:hypothetical protein